MKRVKELYEALIAHVNTKVLDNSQLPLFTWQDLWYSQTDFPEEAEGIDYPAVFYAFSTAEIEALGLDSKAIDLLCSIYVCTHNYLDTHSESSERANGGLEFLENCGLLDEQLHGQPIGGIGTFRQVGFEPYDSRTNMIVYRLDYAVTFLDESALRANNDTETVDLGEQEACLGIIDRDSQPIPQADKSGLGFDL